MLAFLAVLKSFKNSPNFQFNDSGQNIIVTFSAFSVKMEINTYIFMDAAKVIEGKL